MTETITATSLTNLVNDSAITTANAEALIMQAIDMLVTAGASIDQLTGAEESRTGDYTQAVAGAIRQMSVACYAQMYKSSGASSNNVTMGSVGFGQSTSQSGGVGSLEELAETLAKKLKGSSIAFVVSEDTSGLE